MATQRERGDEVDSSYAEPWKPEKEGEEIEGIYLGYSNVPSPRKGQEPFKSYNIKIADGTYVGVSGAILGSKLVRIPKGAYIWVKYVGMIKTGNGLAKDFIVTCERGTKLLDPKLAADSEDSGDDIDF